MYPNSALSAWQLAIMAVVAVATLAAWLIAIYVAAREPSGHNQAAAASPAEVAEAATAGIGSRTPAPAGRTPAPAGRERERPPIDRAVA